MKPLVIAAAVSIASLIAAHRHPPKPVLHSPKGAAHATSLGKPMAKAVIIAGPRTNILAFRYPTNHAVVYMWVLQRSTDLVHWTNISTNDQTPIVFASNYPAAFFREMGLTNAP